MSFMLSYFVYQNVNDNDTNHVIPYNRNVKVIEKCTNFYFGTEKLPSEVLRIDQYCEKLLGMLVNKSFFSMVWYGNVLFDIIE